MSEKVKRTISDILNEGDLPKRPAEELSGSPVLESAKTGKMDLDTIVAELGQFGVFQWRLMGMCAVIGMFAAWAASEYLFTTARISTRCVIPECDVVPPQWSPGWQAAAIPALDSSGALHNCRRFSPVNSSTGAGATPAPAGDVCPDTLFDPTRTEDCQEYVYENRNTIVYDYNLACDEWRRTLIGSMRTVGNLLALPITGYISDRWGRRVALTLTAFNCAWLGVVRYWADTYVGFMVSEVAEAIAGSSIFTSFYILLIETIGVKYRTVAGALSSCFFATGQMTLGLIAWAVPYWRNLTLILYIPQLISIFYFWILPESARWYMSKGRYKESEEVLQKIAKVNGRTLSPTSLEALRQLAQKHKQKQELEKIQKLNEPWLIVTVFRHKQVLLRCIIAPVWWITNTFIYYGLSINAVNMVGNRYLNYVAVSAAEIPGFWTAVLLLGKLGRKPVLIGAFWICAACQVAYIFIPSDYYGLSLTFYLLGKYAIAIVATSLYIYTAELYPTKHRHSMFAFTSMVGRIGAIVAPLTPAFAEATFEEFPFVLFGSFALVSGILLFFTPETLGTKLPDTMQEAEDLNKK